MNLYDDYIRAAAMCPMCQQTIALDLVDRTLMPHYAPAIATDCPGSRLKPNPSGHRP
jgi:hypothetical protein